MIRAWILSRFHVVICRIHLGSWRFSFCIHVRVRSLIRFCSVCVSSTRNNNTPVDGCGDETNDVGDNLATMVCTNYSGQLLISFERSHVIAIAGGISGRGVTRTWADIYNPATSFSNVAARCKAAAASGCSVFSGRRCAEWIFTTVLLTDRLSTPPLWSWWSGLCASLGAVAECSVVAVVAIVWVILLLKIVYSQKMHSFSVVVLLGANIIKGYAKVGIWEDLSVFK